MPLRIIGIVLGALVIVFCVHPWLLAFPDRVAEWRTQRSIHIGMSRPQVEAVLRRTHSTFEPLELNGIAAYYAHLETVCIFSGMRYEFRFDLRGDLRSITSVTYDDAC